MCLNHVYHCLDDNGMIEKDNTSLFSSMHTPVSSSQCVSIMFIISLIAMVWLKKIISAYLVVYTPVSSGQCLNHVYHCRMIKKDNTSLFSSMHTPVSSGQCVFIMYIIALITMV